MPLPSMLTFNELNGEEVKAVLTNRFADVMREVPYFARHLTMPRVRMTLRVELEIWADQPSPETVTIGDMCEVVLQDPVLKETIVGESVDSTAPGDGHPPDQIREWHGLPISAPAKGPKDIGGHLAISDQASPAADYEPIPGVSIRRTENNDPMFRYATIATIDQGPAGLSRGEMNRERFTMSRGVPPSRTK